MVLECHIVAGSNGAGKTTFAREFLPRYAHCLNFINPDLIAGGLSPFDPSRAIVKAGRLVLEEIAESVRRRDDFAFETTLSGRTHLNLIRSIRVTGYRAHMFYLWIPSAEMAVARIRDRVDQGGHDVPETDVRRRYSRSLRNLFCVYRKELDSLHFFDNSTAEPRMVFHEEQGEVTIIDRRLYDRIIATAGGHR
ncbi:hypothetical protein JXA88_08120 [Candidatus Fermentibacteria bacterium]|nr:hypothetical protein [Candidatus Fermentibacteria bacterium]